MARFGANEGQPVCRDDISKISILSKKTDARMHSISACNTGCCDNGGDVQIGLAAAWRADADRFVSKAHRHRISIRCGMNDHGGDLHFLAGAQHPQRDVPPIGDENFLEHYSMMTRASPNSTGCAFCTRIWLTVPSFGAVIGFMTFMASTISRVCPFFTALPTSIKASAPGSGEV